MSCFRVVHLALQRKQPRPQEDSATHTMYISWARLESLVQYSSAFSKLYWLLKYIRRDPYRVGIDSQVRYLDVIKLIPSHTDLEILELGCGEGQFTEMLARKASYIRATDISWSTIRRAGRRLACVSNVEFVVHDLIHEALEENAYSLVVCMETLYYGPRDILDVCVDKIGGPLACEVGSCWGIGGKGLSKVAASRSRSAQRASIDFSRLYRHFPAFVSRIGRRVT